MNWFLRLRRAKRWVLFAVMLSAMAAVSGCHELGFYAQAIHGQYEIFARQKPVDELVADPSTPAELKAKLQIVRDLRAFAEQELKLPVNGHYRKYTDLHRPFVVWNVQATPKFSLQPKTWWYPLVGSLEYRGYFSESGARDTGARLARKKYDVYVDGVEAYSTLGWFKDPVLNTFIDRPEAELAEVIFHELGHQRVFASGDTDFNEAFATTVGQEGAHRWLAARGDTNAYTNYLVSLHRNDQFVHLVLNSRAELEKVYGDTRDKDGKIKAAKKSPAPPDQLQAQKERVFADLRRKYADLKASWGGFSGYDAWFAHELNNAKLNTIANYYDYLPGFEELLRMNNGDLEKFYAATERLSNMSQDERHQWLRDLASSKGKNGATNEPAGEKVGN
jgi:predicted aminopeptidase